MATIKIVGDNSDIMREPSMYNFALDFLDAVCGDEHFTVLANARNGDGVLQWRIAATKRNRIILLTQVDKTAQINISTIG